MREIITGIYSIKNIVNNKLYIGSSIDIYKRWAYHKRELKNGIHHSRHLQHSFDKYGEDNFVFDIVEKCDKEVLLEKEQYWIDYYKSYDRAKGYNIAPIAGAGYSYGGNYERLKDGKYKISLEQFNNIIYLLQNSSASIPEIAKIVNCSKSIVYSIYQRKSYREITTNMVFIKRRVDSQYNYKTIITEEQAKQVVDLLLKGLRLSEVSEQTGVNYGTVRDIKNKHSWKSLTTNIIFPEVNVIHPKKWKPIKQLDMDGNLIKYFPSMKSAMEEIGTKYNSTLCAALNGRKESAYGSKWEYA